MGDWSLRTARRRNNSCLPRRAACQFPSSLVPLVLRLFVIPLLRVYTREERKGDIMKINLLGAIVLIGGVASLTAACSGNPLKPQALNPGFGDGGSSNGSVNLSDP